MFDENTHKCDVCGKILASWGCCITPDIKDACKEDLCESCKKAVKDAKEQQIYLKSCQ